MRIRGGCGQAFGNIASRGAFVQIVYFISGFIASRAAVFGSYAPFGISIMAAAPFKNMLASVFGAAIGYCTISGTGNTIRYVTAMIALAAIRWTLNDIARIRKSKLFAPIITFMALIATGLAMMSVSGFSGRSMVLYMIEAVLGSSGAYFLSRTITISYGTKKSWNVIYTRNFLPCTFTLHNDTVIFEHNNRFTFYWKNFISSCDTFLCEIWQYFGRCYRRNFCRNSNEPFKLGDELSCGFVCFRRTYGRYVLNSRQTGFSHSVYTMQWHNFYADRRFNTCNTRTL